MALFVHVYVGIGSAIWFILLHGSLQQTEEVMLNSSSQSSNLNESNAMKELTKKMDKNFMDIKSTLGCMMVKINDLDSKVEALSNNLVGSTSAQPVGKRQNRTTTSLENDVEIAPVPPKKKPKVELNSDDEVDGIVYDFKVNKEGFVEVYIDVENLTNHRGSAKGGIGVWFGDNHPLNCSQPVKGRPTNKTVEIQSAVLALEVAKRAGVKKILLHTDTEVLINCITKRVKIWQKNGWKMVSGNPVKNKEDLELLIDAMVGINVKWVHVPGRRGIHGNYMAIKLAREGATKYKSK